MEGVQTGIAETKDWLARYGPVDGPWLQKEFDHITQGLDHIEYIRVARRDDEAEMTRFREQADDSELVLRDIDGNWEVTSPLTGIRYIMGCNWHDE